MCGIVVSLPVYGADDGAFDPHTLAALLPDAPAGDPADSGIPDLALLDEWDKALTYAADQFRSPGAIRLVGDPATDRAAVALKLERLDDWVGRLDRALDAQPQDLDA